MTVALVIDDGGRMLANFTGAAGDCVTRAIAIATGVDYRTIYDAVTHGLRHDVDFGDRTASRGAPRRVFAPIIDQLGFVWTPTMSIGSGCRVHLRGDELPNGRLIARCSRHLVAVIDGVIHDTHDSSRDGTRCVYGYWTAPDLTPAQFAIRLDAATRSKYGGSRD